MIWFAAPTPPQGFIECNGQSTAAYPALAAVVGATVPDLRGQFVRGWDHSRVFGSYEADSFKEHNHLNGVMNDTSLQFVYGSSIADIKGFATCVFMGQLPQYPWSLQQGYTSKVGSNETRPKNITLLPCIKF